VCVCVCVCVCSKESTLENGRLGNFVVVYGEGVEFGVHVAAIPDTKFSKVRALVHLHIKLTNRGLLRIEAKALQFCPPSLRDILKSQCPSSHSIFTIQKPL
jgi:hypothetical protein